LQILRKILLVAGFHARYADWGRLSDFIRIHAITDARKHRF
jgi:hypothetical protein